MEEKELLTKERHQNITMLTELLEKVREYDRLVAVRDEKQADVRALENEIARPMPKLPLGKMILFGVLTVAAAIICFFIHPIVSVIVVAAVITVLVLRHRKKVEQWEQRLQALRIRLEDAKKTYRDACNTLDEYNEKVLSPYVESIVPERFPRVYCMDAVAIESMLTLLIDLRADTIKEAINLHEEILHRQFMESNLSKVLAQTRSMASSAARAAAAQESQAASAAVSAAAMTSIAHSASRQAAASERSARAHQKAADAISHRN